VGSATILSNSFSGACSSASEVAARKDAKNGFPQAINFSPGSSGDSIEAKSLAREQRQLYHKSVRPTLGFAVLLTR